MHIHLYIHIYINSIDTSRLAAAVSALKCGIIQAMQPYHLLLPVLHSHALAVRTRYMVPVENQGMITCTCHALISTTPSLRAGAYSGKSTLLARVCGCFDTSVGGFDTR